MDTLKVRDAKDVEQAVRDAIAAEQPLEIIGHGTKRAIGQPMATNALLDLSTLNAVTLYEPNELVITLQANAPMADVLSLIDSKNQQFAFEPMDTSLLLGTPRGAGTIGGTVSAGLAGPRRIKAGGARDHLLGFHGVSGFGDSFKAGGRVVKNVTGYDLSKLIAGSWGTLSVITEMTLKVMPKPEREQTLVLSGLDNVSAGRAMTASLGSSFDVSAAAHLPASKHRGSVKAFSKGESDKALTLIRLEGIGASVPARAKSLSDQLSSYGRVEVIEDMNSAEVWAAIRDAAQFASSGPLGSWPVWRIVCPPASGCAFGQALARETGGELFYDWGGGLIWAALPPSPDAHGKMLRDRLKAIGGHATLIRATDQVRNTVDVFHPQQASVAALGRRVKASFDPKNILNRGRMVRA
ncbi:MAG: FAD-binding protein [Afipia sp.]|nr:FAD-binding protein [Afipia sp.]